MTGNFTALAIFCEDIREEQSGVVSLIGVLPDNINLGDVANFPRQPGVNPPPPKILPKLCVYVRINLDLNEVVPDINLQLVMPDGNVLPFAHADGALIQKSKDQARMSSLPFAGLVMRAMMAPFQLPKPGIMRVEAVMGSGNKVLGAINFQKMETTTSPTVN